MVVHHHIQKMRAQTPRSSYNKLHIQYTQAETERTIIFISFWFYGATQTVHSAHTYLCSFVCSHAEHSLCDTVNCNVDFGCWKAKKDWFIINNISNNNSDWKTSSSSRSATSTTDNKNNTNNKSTQTHTHIHSFKWIVFGLFSFSCLLLHSALCGVLPP